jgi:hypothetical protein
MIKLAKFMIVLVLFVTIGPLSFAEVAWDIQSTLKFDATPLDIALSPDGKSVFVLTDGGDILIYDSKGTLKDKIAVGLHVDQIRIGPRGDRLFATSRQNKTVEVITLDFIKSINITGSPFKGARNAPIVIVEFSEFQ